MILKIRNYPLSTKLTGLNTMLLCLNIFSTLGVFVVITMMLGGPGSDFSGIKTVFLFLPPFVFFIVVHRLINKYTDNKYNVILSNYEEICSKLINEDIEHVKDKQLTYPASITFSRLVHFESRLAKIKYIINGNEYKLSNGETINFTTNKALNTIEVKSLTFNDLKYFTVSDGEKMTIEYCVHRFKNVERK